MLRICIFFIRTNWKIRCKWQWDQLVLSLIIYSQNTLKYFPLELDRFTKTASGSPRKSMPSPTSGTRRVYVNLWPRGSQNESSLCTTTSKKGADKVILNFSPKFTKLTNHSPEEREGYGERSRVLLSNQTFLP